jgi:hypothetical protein
LFGLLPSKKAVRAVNETEKAMLRKALDNAVTAKKIKPQSSSFAALLKIHRMGFPFAESPSQGISNVLHD